MSKVLFVAIGDVGTGDNRQYGVAKTMSCFFAAHPFPAVLLLGDNIYEHGEIERIEDTFEIPYGELRSQKVKFYAAIGNHDIETNNGEDQIRYAGFNMDGRYYTFERGNVQFFALDTNPEAPWQEQLDWLDRSKTMDLRVLEQLRELILNGRFPLVVAPEGATNGHSEIVSPLEPGVAQLAFWNVEDLAKANRVEETVVLPINIQYHYINPQWFKLDRLLANLERDCSLSPPRDSIDSGKPPKEVYYPRLLRLGNYLVCEMEQFYRCFYHYQLSVAEPNLLVTEANLTDRLQKLLDISLQTGESYFNLEQNGNFIKRCRRLEEAGWNYIYRYPSEELKNLSPVQRGLADWIAAEAELRMLHMRLAESFVAVQGSYLQEKPSFERFAETSLILFDASARIKGKKSPRRPRLGWRKSTVTVGKPVNVSSRAATYRQNRQEAKKAVARLTQDIQTALENMIVP